MKEFTITIQEKEYEYKVSSQSEVERRTYYKVKLFAELNTQEEVNLLHNFIKSAQNRIFDQRLVDKIPNFNQEEK